MLILLCWQLCDFTIEYRAFIGTLFAFTLFAHSAFFFGLGRSASTEEPVGPLRPFAVFTLSMAVGSLPRPAIRWLVVH